MALGESLREPVNLTITASDLKSRRFPADVFISTALDPREENYHLSSDGLLQIYRGPNARAVCAWKLDHHPSSSAIAESVTNPDFLVLGLQDADPQASIEDFRNSKHEALWITFWGLERAVELARELRAKTPDYPSLSAKEFAIYQLIPWAVEKLAKLAPGQVVEAPSGQAA